MAAELIWLFTHILYQRRLCTKRNLRSLTMCLEIQVEISGERGGREKEREREIQWNSVTAPLGECTGGHSAHAN